MYEMKTECTCEKCIECCWRSPGWFGSIDEVIGAAKIMNMPLNVFVDEYLIREWYYAEVIEIPAPRKNFNRSNKSEYNNDLWLEEAQRNGRGFVRASWGHNLMTGYACIFLTDDMKCQIHDSKPTECRLSFGCKELDKQARQKTEDYWKDHQDFVRSFNDN